LNQTILLVDDDEGMLQLLEIILKRKGYSVIKTLGGEAALRSLSIGVPDMAIVDLMMPGMNGIELSQHIRSTPEYSRLPILILSANLSLELIQQSKDAGATDYASKPVSPQELIETVHRLLSD
jgi:CheY-like chemotaxis protein